MNKSLIRTTLIAVMFGISVPARIFAQKATVKEYGESMPSYLFSDPDPIPNPASLIYPYFRFDGFTDKAVMKTWKVVELENDFIKVTILPEIGGKIWSAEEKSTGKSFIYHNHVVKFRDVAMRGPWTSGGIEANYGIIGHTPNCATPVDYTTIEKKDGSVSCIIGVRDLLSGSEWRIDINLPKDKAYFTTTSYWHNYSNLEQPYYSWMNSGIKAKGNLQLIYPGTHYLGHEGEFSDWPINKQNGKDISFYENNNFGGYKSYHVFGKSSEFFGAYWHDDKFGMGRFSSRDDKAGKKIWIWGLSGQGMIWEHLLTDHDGQYVEVQSGRLFNQSAEGSTLTPFKHRGFAPYATDRWTEYWFPVKETRGFVQANEYGALNLIRENGSLKVLLSPLQSINALLTVSTNGKRLFSKTVNVLPMINFADSFKIDAAQSATFDVMLGENLMSYHSSPDSGNLARPLSAPTDFNWENVYGQYLQGKEDVFQRHYVFAEEKFRACLNLDPNYLPALVELGALQFRNLLDTEALATLKRALSINTYDAAANFNYGLVNARLGRTADAIDGFNIAAQDITFRSAAYTELARLSLAQNDFPNTLHYAKASLDVDNGNIDAMRMLAVTHRLQNNTNEAQAVIRQILDIDPINHFAHFENFLLKNSDDARDHFTSSVKNELPYETYLDLAVFYAGIHRNNDAKKLLNLSPQTFEIKCWKAYLSEEPLPGILLDDNVSSFAFRAETASILDSLIHQNDRWELKYALGLIWWSRNNLSKAKKLFEACGEIPAKSYFFAARASLLPDHTESDLRKAIQLDNTQWRYYKMLSNYFLDKHSYDSALSVAEIYFQNHSDNYIMGMLFARTLLLNRKYAQTDAVLSHLNIIPFEGATDGRRLYHEAKLMQCISEWKKSHYKAALTFIADAKRWPENLGVGKPYQNEIDERLEDWLAFVCYKKIGNMKLAEASLAKILAFQRKRENTVSNFYSSNTLVTAWALRASDRNDEGKQLLEQWLQEHPKDIIAEWGNRVYSDPLIKAPTGAMDKDENVRIIEAYLLP